MSSKLQLTLIKCPNEPIHQAKTMQPSSSNIFISEDLERIRTLMRQEPPTPENEAPESPDPRSHHRSKLIRGIPQEVKESTEDLVQEHKRLRDYYKGMRAESSLHERKYGEIRRPDYNDWL